MPKVKVPTKIKELVYRAMQENIALPMSQRAAYKDGKNNKRVPGTGVRTARRLLSGSVDREQLELMRAWFARHGESEKEKEARKDRTSKASRAWRLWGGSLGRQWVESTLRDMERKDKDMQ